VLLLLLLSLILEVVVLTTLPGKTQMVPRSFQQDPSHRHQEEGAEALGEGLQEPFLLSWFLSSRLRAQLRSGEEGGLPA